MAVFTEVSFDEASSFIEPFELGQLTSLKGIASGIENTNYFVSTTQGDYVLTLFERLPFEQLPFYLELMRHLAAKSIPVPAPQPHKKGKHAGEILHRLKNKPAAVVQRLRGHVQLSPDAHHCAQLGQTLAQMHTAVQDFTMQQPNLRGLSWWEQVIPQILPHLNAEQSKLLQDELVFQQQLATSQKYQHLPRGAIHADLFRDNVMFDGMSKGNEKLSGVFDFYFAGVDTFLFDIAVCLNDWCVHLDTGTPIETHTQALLEAYDKHKPLTSDEKELLPHLLRSAAMRFWTSRLWDYYLPRQAQLLTPHDPTHFERILKQRIQATH